MSTHVHNLYCDARIIGAGEVVLVEDITGRGHLSKSVNNQMRHSIFVPIE